MTRHRKAFLVVGCVVLLLAWLLVWLDYRYLLQLPDNDNGFARVVTDRHGELLRTFADKPGYLALPGDTGTGFSVLPWRVNQLRRPLVLLSPGR